MGGQGEEEGRGGGQGRRKRGGRGRGEGEGRGRRKACAVDVRDLVAYGHISLTTFAAPEMAQGRPPSGRGAAPLPRPF